MDVLPVYNRASNMHLLFPMWAAAVPSKFPSTIVAVLFVSPLAKAPNVAIVVVLIGGPVAWLGYCTCQKDE